jgi:hypothetical protein
MPASRRELRVSAALIALSVVVSVAAGIQHPGREPPNGHLAVFMEYAASADWTRVHLGQFAGMALMVAGLLLLVGHLNTGAGATRWLSRLSAMALGVSLALYAALQAIDGVALKQAVDAWNAAPEQEKLADLRWPRGCAGWSGGCAAITALSGARRSFWLDLPR